MTLPSSAELLPTQRRGAPAAHLGWRWIRLALLCSIVTSSLAGCRDGLSPEARAASVRIYLASFPYDEQTIGLGQTLQLRAEVRDQAGKAIEGLRVDWRSSSPEVASVDAAGLVTARTLGTALVIARHSAGEDTARVNVAAAVPEAVSCAPGDEIQLGVGQTRTLAGQQAAGICLTGGVSGAEYAVITFNAARSATSTLNVQLRPTGVSDVVGPPRPSLAPAPAGVSQYPIRDADFHERLRSGASSRLEPRLRAGVAPGAFPEGPRLQQAVGQTLSFNVATTGDPCTEVSMRGGRVRAVSERAIVVADTLNPVGGFTDADYSRFAQEFDSRVWPLVTTAFGEPSDIDGNGRVYIFFTRAVNDLDANRGSGSYIGGFFFNRDLFARTGRSACDGSNASEMFYMLVPNPFPSRGERQFTHDFVSRSASAVLVHEFQHLVNDSRRLHVNRSPVWEETWLNEGLSHIAEELAFYAVSGLAPGVNLGRRSFEGSQARQAFNVYQMDNVERWIAWLRDPESASLMGPDVLSTRGASWAFLRYAADRQPGREDDLWKALVRDTRTAGLANLQQALGVDPLEWMNDWASAVYLDDTGLDAESRHRIESWNFRELIPAGAALFGMRSEPQYPLKARTLGAQTLALQGGGAAYFRARVLAGGDATLRVTVGQLPPPERLRVTIVRTR